MRRGSARCVHRRRLVRLLLLAAMFSACTLSVEAQESVQISLPLNVSFQVVDVSVSAAVGPTSITFSNGTLGAGRALRISVRAEGNLTPPSGPAIPASNVSWTTSNVSSGVGVNGTLSAAAYNQVFESQVDATSGGFDLSWTLSAPGTPRHAGNHQATLRWKLEAITP